MSHLEIPTLPALDHDTLERLLEIAPPAHVKRMKEGFEVFEGLELPTGAEESWRYVHLDLDLDSLALALSPGPEIPPATFVTALERRAGTAVVVDGHTVHVQGEGVEVLPAREVDPSHPMFDAVAADHDIFSAARRAFGTDGVLVRIPANRVVEEPIVIDVQATSGVASFPFLGIEVGPNGEGSVVVVYRSNEGAGALLSPQVSLRTEDGARLRFLAVQNLDFTTTGIIHQRAVAGRDSSIRVGEVGLGGKLGRVDLGILLEGAGASGEVVGLSFGEHDQTLDYRMVITHRGRNTSSDVFLKGAVEDEAQSVFTGLLQIEKDAVRSSAFETNRNLVLSEGAKAHSVPNLEILCDDVVCGHGSSVGPLDEDHLYYLQSRGLSRERAERLLIRGFFQEVIDRLPVRGLEGPVQAEVFERFLQAQTEGRVA